jgi:hypothetical protein
MGRGDEAEVRCRSKEAGGALDHEIYHGVQAETATCLDSRQVAVIRSAPDRIRTCDLRLRRPTLYPAELRARVRDGEANKPSSVTRAGARGRIISLGPTSPPASCSLPGIAPRRTATGAGNSIDPCLALLRVGFTLPPTLPPARCALTATVSPLPVPLAHAVGHRRSALCCTFRRLTTPGRYPAPCPVELGLSSTPSWSAAILTRLPYLDCQSAVPRRGLEPPRPLRHQILSLACLPVSAPGHEKPAACIPRTVLPRGLEPPRACAH